MFGKHVSEYESIHKPDFRYQCIFRSSMSRFSNARKLEMTRLVSINFQSCAIYKIRTSQLYDPFYASST
jgi:hypothetical protein